MTHDDARMIHDTAYDARTSTDLGSDLLTRPRPEVPCQPGTVLNTGREVLDHLVGLVGPRLPASPVAWFTFLDGARRVVPLAIPFDGLPGLPSSGAVAEIVDVVSSVLAQHPDGLVVLVAISRPGGGLPGAFERRWAKALWKVADDAGWTVDLMAAVGTDRAAPLDRSGSLDHAAPHSSTERPAGGRGRTSTEDWVVTESRAL